jgi:hypothetical protein
VSSRVLEYPSSAVIRKQIVSEMREDSIKPKDTDKYYCIFPSNGYNIIKTAFADKPGWKEVKKDDVWKALASQKVNFIWKPCNFNYKVSISFTD